MDVDVSISPATVRIGQPVTVTYSAVDCADVTLTVPNFPNPIDLGGGESISGSIKLLPMTDGQFTVTVTGSGRFSVYNDYVAEITKDASCSVT
jgi:hypothetical protein